MGPSTEVARRGIAISQRAQGKVPTMQVGQEPPALTNEQLVCQLLVEEVADRKGPPK